MGRKRRLGESIQDLRGRSGQRVRHDRCNRRQSPPAQRRGSKKGDSNEAIGRSRGGLTTKIHTIVDALGNPLAVSLTGGHVHDVTQAQVLTQEIEPAALLADKGYDSDGFIEHLEVRCIKPVIPPRANRKTPRECDSGTKTPATSNRTETKRPGSRAHRGSRSAFLRLRLERDRRAVLSAYLLEQIRCRS